LDLSKLPQSCSRDSLGNQGELNLEPSSCEHTCTKTRHYNAFRCFIVTAIKTLQNKADLIIFYEPICSYDWTFI